MQKLCGYWQDIYRLALEATSIQYIGMTLNGERVENPEDWFITIGEIVSEHPLMEQSVVVMSNTRNRDAYYFERGAYNDGSAPPDLLIHAAIMQDVMDHHRTLVVLQEARWEELKPQPHVFTLIHDKIGYVTHIPGCGLTRSRPKRTPLEAFAESQFKYRIYYASDEPSDSMQF